MVSKAKRFLLSILAIAIVTAGCSSAPSASKQPTPTPQEQVETTATKYPITLKDATGREITIQAEPKRIVSVAPSNTELVFALGKGSSLVGRSEFDDYPAEAAAIPSIGGFFPPDYEKILALQPDLILVLKGSEEARTKLETEYHLTTFAVDPQNFEELYAGVSALGQVINAQKAAAQLVKEMRTEVDAVAAKTAGATTKPVVFYQVWDDPLMAAGPNSFIDDMIRIAGGVNAAAAATQAWAQFPVEQLAAADPEIIVTGLAESAQKVRERQGWESFRAVKNGKVFSLPDENIAVRPGPRLIQGLRWFAEHIHPEIFTK